MEKGFDSRSRLMLGTTNGERNQCFDVTSKGEGVSGGREKLDAVLLDVFNS